jgi:hypothetical protein
VHSAELIRSAIVTVPSRLDNKHEGPCPSCLRPNDIFGDHARFCATEGERISCHDRIRDDIYRAAATAGLAPKREAPHLFPDSSDRPGDVLIPAWFGGRGVALDVTVTSPTQAAQVSREAANAGATLVAAKQRKLDRYLDRCRSVGIDFVPLAVETFGGWDANAVDSLKAIARNVGRRSDVDHLTTTRHLFQRLGVTLQRGNAILLGGRRPKPPPALVTGDPS